jgi:hypothetical protein
MLKDKLTIAAHITRKTGPYVGMVTMFLVAAHDLKQNRKS